MLGGDLLLTADHPWSEQIRDEARLRGLTTTDSVSFPSMVSAAGGVYAPEGTQLAEVKAVAPGHPPRRTDNDGRLASRISLADTQTRQAVTSRSDGNPGSSLA